MASAQENLITARDQIAALIVTLTADPNPDVTVAGRSINKGTYLTQLAGQLATLERAIQDAGGAFEVRTFGA